MNFVYCGTFSCRDHDHFQLVGQSAVSQYYRPFMLNCCMLKVKPPKSHIFIVMTFDPETSSFHLIKVTHFLWAFLFSMHFSHSFCYIVEFFISVCENKCLAVYMM